MGIIKSKGYKIVRREEVYYVINESENADMAKKVYLYSSKIKQNCINWVSRKKAWFKKNTRLNYPLDTVGNID